MHFLARTQTNETRQEHLHSAVCATNAERRKDCVYYVLYDLPYVQTYVDVSVRLIEFLSSFISALDHPPLLL